MPAETARPSGAEGINEASDLRRIAHPDPGLAPRRTLHRFTAAAIALLAFALFAAPAQAGRVGVRLREHFDVSRILWGEPGVEQTYFGATNTVNLWWEEPGWAFGLAFNPVLSGGYGAIGDKSPLVDDGVKLFHFGLEGKYHFRRGEDAGRRGPFARAGLFASHMSQVNQEFGSNRWGGSYYASLGWEIPLFGERIGVQPDIGFRHTILENDTQVLSFSPSIAVSLYFISDWLEGLR